MPDRSWKAFERRLARSLGTCRLPATGERAGADFETQRFVYEAKKGRRFPAYLARWLDEIGSTGNRRGKVGVLVWQTWRGRDGKAVVLIPFADWVALQVEQHPTAPEAGGAGLRHATQAARQRLATLPGATICVRQGCDRPIQATRRRHGSPRRFCSARCRWLAWRATHQPKSGAAP